MILGNKKVNNYPEEKNEFFYSFAFKKAISK